MNLQRDLQTNKKYSSVLLEIVKRNCGYCLVIAVKNIYSAHVYRHIILLTVRMKTKNQNATQTVKNETSVIWCVLTFETAPSVIAPTGLLLNTRKRRMFKKPTDLWCSPLFQVWRMLFFSALVGVQLMRRSVYSIVGFDVITTNLIQWNSDSSTLICRAFCSDS